MRWIETTPRGVSWWGLLYGGNTAGAVFGCLLAGFYLLRIYDTVMATYWAMAINLVVAAASYLVAGRVPAHGAAESRLKPTGSSRFGRTRWTRGGPSIVTIGLSGASALGAEVVWTRLMGMLMGATVYVFSIILAVFLIGLAVGSGIGACISRSARPRVALGWCQILLAIGTAWSGIYDRRRAALLAHRSVPCAEPVDDIPARYGAHAVDDSAARDPVGREFPAGAGGGRRGPAKIRAASRAKFTRPIRWARFSAR